MHLRLRVFIVCAVSSRQAYIPSRQYRYTFHLSKSLSTKFDRAAGECIGADERGPDGDLRLRFEAISKFAPEEKQVIKRHCSKP